MQAVAEAAGLPGTKTKRHRVIAVAGAKGSPGCTFVAIGLASRLAASGIATLLIDADHEAAGVGGHLDLPGIADRTPLLGYGPPSTAALMAAAQPASGFAALDLSGDHLLPGAATVAAAREAYAAVVADLGHQVGPFQAEVAAAADWLLWVFQPDRLGVERADRAIGAGRLQAPAVALVANRAGHGLADAAGVLGRRHQVPLATTIPERSWAAREALRRCLPPDRIRAFQHRFAELARCVHPDAGGGGGRAWP